MLCDSPLAYMFVCSLSLSLSLSLSPGMVVYNFRVMYLLCSLINSSVIVKLQFMLRL